MMLSLAAPGEPTGLLAVDVVLRAVVAGAVTVASSAARSWTWVLAITVVAVAAPHGLLWAAAAAELLVLGIVIANLPQRRLVGAVIGALAASLAQHLGAGWFDGATALVAAVAFVPLTISGWRLASRPIRRRAAAIVGGVATAYGVILVVFAVSVLDARSQLNQGISRAEAGMAAARSGDTSAAASELDAAAAAFTRAHDRVSSPLAKMGRLVPIVAQHAELLDVASAQGAVVSRAAADTSDDVDLDQLRVRTGQIDLDLMSSMQPSVEHLHAVVAEADARISELTSPWLIGPARARLQDLEAELDRAAGDASLAATTLATAPHLLGRDGPRHYFVILATPAEARDLGGFMGHYGELVVDDGRFDLVQAHPVEVLNAAGRGNRQLTAPERLPERFRSLRLEQFWQNVTGTADFPTVAEAVRQLWPQSGGGQLDGVVYLDPVAVGALLQLGGPVRVPGLDVTLSDTTTPPFILRDQYVQIADDETRTELLVAAVEGAFAALTSRDLPGPRAIADVLDPIVDGGHLLLHSFDPVGQDLFERIGAAGSLKPADEGADVLAVRTTNAAPNKLDPYVRRDIDYQVTYDPGTGFVEARANVSVSNSAPTSGLPATVLDNLRGFARGTSVSELSIYTPLDLEAVTLDGVEAPVSVHQEYGRNVYTVPLAVPAGTTQSLSFDLRGSLARRQYRLTVEPQGLAVPDRFRAVVRARSGWKVEAATGATPSQSGAEAALAERDLVADVQVTADFPPR